MSLTCQCPASQAIPTIPVAQCAESLGQIQKVAFVRLMDGDGNKNSFSTTNDIKKLASWTPKLTATDGTKIAVSPYIEAPENEAGASRTFGGGNETLGGIEMIVGREPSTFTGAIRQQPQAVIKAMKELQCEAQAGNLGIFIFDENGRIECVKGGSTSAPVYYPIPIRGLFIGDKTHGGLEAPDSNSISWSFLPNYSDDLTIVTPEFNPLTDLVVSA